MPKTPAKPPSPPKPKPAPKVAKPAAVAKPVANVAKRVTLPNFVPATKPVTKPGTTPAKTSLPTGIARPAINVSRPVIAQPANVKHPLGTSTSTGPAKLPVSGRPGIGTTPLTPRTGPATGRPGTSAPAGVGHGTATAPIKVAPSVLRAVPVSHPQVTPQVNNLRFINPDFARNIVNLRPGGEGVTRDQIKVPICPAIDVTDEVLFESPAAAGTKFYLPRYKVATDHQRYQISFHQGDAGWSLVVNLTKFAAPSIASAAGSAQELDHHVAVLLRFSQMIGNQAGAQEELSFQEVTSKGGVLQATLRLDSLQQRDLLYQALSDRTFGTTLVVRRAVTVAVP